MSKTMPGNDCAVKTAAENRKRAADACSYYFRAYSSEIIVMEYSMTAKNPGILSVQAEYQTDAERI